MAKIVGVHGIGAEKMSVESMHHQWWSALEAGLERALLKDLAPDLFSAAFYGDLYLAPSGTTPLAKGVARSERPVVVEDSWERAFIEACWREAAAANPDESVGAQRSAKGGFPVSLQRMLQLLNQVPFFGGLTRSAVLLCLRQVKRYLKEDALRAAIQKRFVEAVDPRETQVVVAHSLGSVVAYEGLCAHPEWNVKVLVTMGSPLGVPKLVFDQLRPAPADDVGHWPGKVERWTNVVDRRDVVALEKELQLRFGLRVDDRFVDNVAHVHDASKYLQTAEVGTAIRAGLEDGSF